MAVIDKLEAGWHVGDQGCDAISDQAANEHFEVSVDLRAETSQGRDFTILLDEFTSNI